MGRRGVDTVLTRAQGPSDGAKGVVGECPAGSVLALIELKYVCLKQGQACKSTPAWQNLYRAYAFRCKRGRLTHLPKSKGFTHLVDIGDYRLAMFCSGSGAPTVVMESGFGWGVGLWACPDQG